MNKDKSELKRYDVVVIGGGIAGLSVSSALLKKGFSSLIIEQKPFLGGQGLKYCCKASEKCNTCSVCLINDYLKEFERDYGQRYFVDSIVTSVENKGESYKLTIKRHIRNVDLNKCITCGDCTKVCPAGDDVIFLPDPQAVPRIYYLDKEKCLHFNGEDCNKCVEVCPEGAINLELESEELLIETDSIIIATGFEPVDASDKYNYHLLKFSNVISGFDAERMIRDDGMLLKPSDRKTPETIAFIQCAGSRDTTRGREYCSRVCCGYSMRISKMLKHQNPEMDITFFYMDIQNFGKNFNEFYKESMENMRFLRAMPSEIKEVDGKLTIKYEDVKNTKIVEENFDLVVLSVGMQPSKDSKEHAKMFGIEKNQDGFFKASDIYNSSNTIQSGIFIAGACTGPKDISESIAHGLSTASKVGEYLNSKRVQN